MGLSWVHPRSLTARPGRALLDEGPPSPFPPSSAARVSRARPFRGPLASVASLAVSIYSLALFGVSSPPSVLCAAPIDGASLALTGTPTGAAGAAPLKCAGMYLASSLLSSLVGAGPTVTGPPTAAATAPLMGCAFGSPAPPDLFSVPVSASASSISVAPRGAAPSLPSVGCSLLGRTVGGFSSPPRPPVSVLPLS